MEIISDDSLELEEIPSDSESEQVTRKSYRVHLEPSDAFYLEVAGQRFSLVDISDGGVCIAVEGDTEFPEDARLNQCTLSLSDKSFANLDGEIAHISVDGDGNWISGIQWIRIEDAVQVELDKALADLRKEFFENA